MQLLTITLSLASAISAIDVFFHANQGCSGVSRLGCYAMNPNACCSDSGVTGSYPSVGYYGIPLAWDIEIGGYTNKEGTNNCPTPLQRVRTRGRNYYCLSGPSGFTGAKWTFASKKRNAETAVGAEQECAKPNVLTLDDGQQYNITSLDDGLLEELMALANNGTGAADIPELFKTFEKNE